jgi:hypothetical protein
MHVFREVWAFANAAAASLFLWWFWDLFLMNEVADKAPPLRAANADRLKDRL